LGRGSDDSIQMKFAGSGFVVVQPFWGGGWFAAR
jgi:uncharacterized protein (AIM24 family)